MARKIKPATTFEVSRERGSLQNGTLLIAEFSEANDKHADFIATLAPPQFATSLSGGNTKESHAVREIADQVRAVLDRIVEIAVQLEQESR